MANKNQNILTENFCPECDEVVHQVFNAEDFFNHKVGLMICPKCGATIQPCNECETHDACGDCPWMKNIMEKSKVMSDESYMRYLKAHEPKIYEMFKSGENGNYYDKVIAKIEKGSETMTRIKEADIFKAVAKNNHYRGRQKINDWYRDVTDEFVFCNNIPEYGGEHYTVRAFVLEMSKYFDGIDGQNDIVEWDGKTGSFVFKKKED